MIYHINNCQICCQFVLKKKNLKLQLITRQFLQLSNVTKWELAISCSQKLKIFFFFFSSILSLPYSIGGAKNLIIWHHKKLLYLFYYFISQNT